MKLILFILFLTANLLGSAVKTTIPTRAMTYLPELYIAIDKYWPGFSLPPLIAAQIEQETCFSMTHNRCWNPNVEFKGYKVDSTSGQRYLKEHGVGLPQITRANYIRNGRVVEKFDALSEMKSHFPKVLTDVSWNNIKGRPDLQMAIITLKDKQNYNTFKLYAKDELNNLIFMLASYNGGVGGLLSEIKYCKRQMGCNPGIWFNNVANVALKSKKPLWGNKSPWEINRDYPHLILTIRFNKYCFDFLNRDSITKK